jgi:HPt (histidine-containing phosphotransfer) domain-containing protein
MPGEEFNTRMRELWRQYLPQQLARLQTVNRAIEALQAGELTSELRRNAAAEAHNLAGSLGAFGLHNASEVAQQIEAALTSHNPLSCREAGDLVTATAHLQREIQNK